jgi:U3 small nucleolar RNA-associated protein 10
MKKGELKGRRPRQPSLKPSQCLLWNRILAVLEMLQVKKNISSIHMLIAPLFDLLKICLDEDEQVSLEYSKQLILSCLLSCCQKLPRGV